MKKVIKMMSSKAAFFCFFSLDADAERKEVPKITKGIMNIP
nr:hypothetical protein [uncultured Flavobacterium sp.]